MVNSGTPDNPNRGVVSTIPTTVTRDLLEVIPDFTSSFTDFVNLNYGQQVLKIPTIFKKEEIEDFNILNSIVPTYEFNTDYNYYTDFYEDIVKTDNSVNESSLPNLYVIGDYLNNASIKYKDIMTVGGMIQMTAKSNENSYEYFDEFGKLYNKKNQIIPFRSARGLTIEQKLDNIALSQSKTYFTGECTRRFNNINKNQFLMPYDIKCSFSTNELSNLANIAEKSQFLDTFNKIMISLLPSFEQSELVFINQYIENIDGTKQIVDKVEPESVLIYNLKSRDELIGRLTDTIRAGGPGRDNSASSLQNIFSLGETEKTNRDELQINGPRGVNNRSNTIQNFIRLQKFSARYTALEKSLYLDTMQFVEKMPFKSDTFMYQLSKYIPDETNFIQTFFFPNISDIDKLNFIDSQVI
jgi:hypothetical protein